MEVYCPKCHSNRVVKNGFIRKNQRFLCKDCDNSFTIKNPQIKSFDIMVQDIIEKSLQEDIGTGDHTTLATIPKNTIGNAKCFIKEDGILAGINFAERVFKKIDSDCTITIHFEDGALVKKGDVAFTVTGKIHTILSCERLVLNVMQRMSGIATHTNQIVKQLEGTKCKVFDTRKTTPLIRVLEKWAVRIGGGVNHRFGLYDIILIKDNHSDYAGGVDKAVLLAKEYLKMNNLSLDIVVEARTLDEVNKILAVGGIKRILLDNMSLAILKEAVTLINGVVQTEASGNINLQTARNVALTGVDYISMGALTHSVKSLDISLKAQIE